MRFLNNKPRLSRKLFIVFFVVVCFLAVINLMCFTGICDVSEGNSNQVWSSFGDVVVEANKMSINNDNLSKLPLYYPLATAGTPKIKLDVAKRLKSLHLTSLDLCPKELVFTSNTTLLAGRRETGPNKRFLTVGIPSIRRIPKSYIKKTLTSIFKAINKEEEENITVVLFLADSDDNYYIKQSQLKDIILAFKKYITKGMLQIIQAPVDFYEPLRYLHRSLGDEMNRVKWRSKQALDYVFLMCYSSSLSKYYLQLEDDVLASPSFVSKIIDFVSSHKHKWFTLNVASLGYIGKLYPAEEVKNIASYIRLFFNDMPVDWLEPLWREFKGLDISKNEFRSASLFQHIGLFSSFRPKESQRPNTLKEHYFDKFDHKYSGLNPPAQITSDLFSHLGPASDAYTRGDKYFWSRCVSAGNKVYHILLNKAVKVKRIVVESGANFAPRDFIQKATLEVSQNIDSSNGKDCSKYSIIGESHFGQIDVTLHKQLVKCIRINIRYQGRWIVIREVNIWPA